MKRNLSLCISALCFFMGFLLLLSARISSQEAMAERIAPQILRFHILAESNAPHDQELKLELKDQVLSWVSKEAPENAGKEELSCWLLSHKDVLENRAESWLSEHGCDAPVRLEVAESYFPTKSYGDMTFPCGLYDAARITIGEGKGHNWWCVLYPSLCFTDSLHAIVPDSSKNDLAKLLSPKDYHALENAPKLKEKTDKSAEKKPEIRVRFRLLSFLSPKTED